jgi:hypothetical protein
MCCEKLALSVLILLENFVCLLQVYASCIYRTS